MKFLFSLALFLFGALFSFSQTSNNSKLQDISVVACERQEDFEYLSAPDSTGYRGPLKTPNFTGESSRQTSINLPYPIIFIHGVNSNSETWGATTDWMDSQYGFIFGGRIDYCLNYDGDDETANTEFYPTPGADIALFTNSTSLLDGDYYYLNFDVGNNGSFHPTWSSADYVHSDQAAIVKQGEALRLAIYTVLQKTGKDKVILFGHSMGGLASREYLQNSSLWQSDGKHHVAKLITSGTPHGGSNSTGLGAASLAGLDEHSEAIRDMRRTYYYSGDQGVYLFGGIEYQDNSNYMNDNISLIDFHNVDVNCNGITGEYITGLNEKSMPYNLDFACIIGECHGCVTDPNPGDGVVWDIQADLNNFYDFTVNPEFNTFYYEATAVTQIHTSLPAQNYHNMQGLDEPNEYELAYGIETDAIYTGFITKQTELGYLNDYDVYRFSISDNSGVNIIVNDIELSNIHARIVNMSGNTIGDVISSDGLSFLTFTQELDAGEYYLEIFGTPTSTSYLSPYVFSVNQVEIVTSIESLSGTTELQIFPNPANDILYIQGTFGETSVSLYDTTGKLVIESDLSKDQSIDISRLQAGMYTIIINSDQEVYTEKILVF